MPKQTVHKIKFNKVFLIPIFIVLLGTGIFYFQKLSSATKIMDNFPIMVINDGQNAVYQEVKLTKDRVEKEIVVSSLKDENQKEVKIYEYIPKEVAEKASELEFSVQPQIIEDDPIILWDLGHPEAGQQVQITYTVKKRMEETQCLHPKYINDMENVYKLDPFDFNDCSKYLHIKFLDAMYKNQKRREQEEKDKVQLIQPGEERYKYIQNKAKEIIKKEAQKPKTDPFSKKLTKEEAIKKAFANFSDTLKGKGEKKDCVCDAVYDEGKKEWHITCTRPPYKLAQYPGRIYHAFYYFTVMDKGKVYIQGKDEGSQECPVGPSNCQYSEMKPDSPW